MYVGECISVNFHRDSTLSDAEVRWWKKQLRCNTIPWSPNRNAPPVRGANMMSSPLPQSRQGFPMLERSKNLTYIYIHTRGSYWIYWESPSLNPTCTLWCFPKVKPYINYVGVSKTKQEHDLPLGRYSGSWSGGKRVVGVYIPQYWRNLLGYPSDVLHR